MRLSTNYTSTISILIVCNTRVKNSQQAIYVFLHMYDHPVFAQFKYNYYVTAAEVF